MRTLIEDARLARANDAVIFATSAPADAGGTAAALARRAGFSDRVSRLRARLRPEHARSALAMADQGVASLGNFATSIILARALVRADFGAFGLVLEGLLFFNAIQAALVTYPLSVKGATSGARDLGRYATAALALTGALALLVSLATLIVGALHGRLALAACACAALVAWQAQETLRRAMIAHLRYAEAIWGDAVSYLGQAALVALLAWRGAASIEATFLCIAFTSSVGACVQLVQVRPCAVRLGQLVAHAREFLRYGRWQAMNNATTIVTAMGYSWALAWSHGAAAVAELYALGILLKLTNPLISGIGGLVVATSAKVHAERGARAAWHTASRYAWIGAAALVPYFALLICFPTVAIRLVHGAASVYAGRENLLRLLVAAAALTYATGVIAAFLSGIHESSRALRAQAMNVLVSLAVGIPMTVLAGQVGGTVGIVLAVSAQLAFLIHFLTHVRGQAEPQQPQQWPRLDALVAARLPETMRPWSDSPSPTRAAA